MRVPYDFTPGKGVNISYRNNPEGLNSLIGGFTQLMFGSAQEVAALRGEDKLRALAVTSEQRLPNLPDVPTMRELGFPTINPTLWYGYVAPVGTPPAIVSKLADAITRAVRAPAFQNRFKPLSFVEDIKTGEKLELTLADGTVGAIATDAPVATGTTSATRPKTKAPGQADLF